MAHDRNMITTSDIARLCAWLTANGIDWRGPKGDFQLLQVRVEDGYGAICTNAKGVVSSPPSLREMLRDFSMGKPHTAQSSKDAIFGGRKAAVANDDFMTDLRDDLAMHALQGLLSNPHFLQPHPETGRSIGPKTPELAARDAYRFADAMLEARKVRP